ncbi:MAG: thiamine diphosphokinase [Acidimicrobiales bacterium]
MAAPGASDSFIVVTGGDALDPAHVADLPADAVVIAADSGIDHALAAGLTVDVAVGDFDSVSHASLQVVSDAGAVVERHPAAKDETDLELALDAAMDRGARQILVLGGHGGRLDHLLANALLLASPKYADAVLVAQMGSARVTVVRDSATLTARPGDLVTLLAMHGPARGVTTDGLLYPLDDDELLPGSTRGVSNELTGPRASVRLREGVLLAVQPGTTDPDQPRITNR